MQIHQSPFLKVAFTLLSISTYPKGDFGEFGIIVVMFIILKEWNENSFMIYAVQVRCSFITCRRYLKREHECDRWPEGMKEKYSENSSFFLSHTFYLSSEDIDSSAWLVCITVVFTLCGFWVVDFGGPCIVFVNVNVFCFFLYIND